MAGRMLSPEEARRVYDRIGARQDTQAFYEDPAVEAMLGASDLASAGALVELGCGTGRLAARLLGGPLPPTATYRGFDSSPVMVRLASERLAPFGARATVTLVDGAATLPVVDRCADRFLSTYVLDLLPGAGIAAAVDEAARILVPGGRLGLVSLTEGTGPLSRVVMAAWRAVHRLRPALVGGCRPVRLAPYLAGPAWQPLLQRTVVSWGVPSEAVVVRRTGAPSTRFRSRSSKAGSVARTM